MWVTFSLDMDVTDAHGQELEPGGRDEPCCQAWVGPASAPAAVPRDAGGKLADFGLDGNPVGVGETSQRGDAFDVAIEGSRGIRRHDPG